MRFVLPDCYLDSIVEVAALEDACDWVGEVRDCCQVVDHPGEPEGGLGVSDTHIPGHAPQGSYKGSYAHT